MKLPKWFKHIFGVWSIENFRAFKYYWQSYLSKRVTKKSRNKEDFNEDGFHNLHVKSQ